ncbi:hypothetical protein DM2_508 [Halorubrum sp. DM2]|uniref:hypothetical protein n=1 Tax=Halorubrum sp. DM2 TaxID=2527867 RepID=UPI0024B78214|nr:hypothetical protein [Halorubrum sp. DM2]VTT85626.1 hypothetical protein DM2_508 [Halorubrum sp. DM2]
MYSTNVVYEVEFDILDDRRERFDAWVATDIIGWVGHESVAAFEVLTGGRRASADSKFVFEFETLQDWAAFVGSDRHKDAVDRLDALAENREATLWRRASVKLDAALDRTASERTDGGRDGHAINTVNSR